MKEIMEQLIQPEKGISEKPYDRYLRAVEEGEAYFRETANFVSTVIAVLQSENKLPSQVMSAADWKSLVTTFIQALDRKTCLDDDEEKKVWILKSARAIYDSTPSGGNRIAPFEKKK